jgi:hypothetical protein
MSAGEKLKTMNTLYPAFGRYISSFSIINAEKLLHFYDKGQLKVTGGLKEVTYSESEGKFRAIFNRSNGIEEAEVFDIVYNCCGLSTDIRKSQPLYEYLSSTKLVNFTMFGSLDSDVKTQRVYSAVTDRVYGCGPATVGNLIAVNFIRGIQA